MKRRDFLRGASTLSTGVLSLSRQERTSAQGRAQNVTATSPDAAMSGADARAWWLSVMTRLSEPVLTHLANGTLKANMPVEAVPAAAPDRRRFSHLEAFGRLLSGIAPWLDLPADDSPEGRARARFAGLAQRALANATDPQSPDHLNFTDGGQALVDTAFLAQAILRAPRTLWEALDAPLRARVIASLESTRALQPGFNNWLLFSATVEAALKRCGARWDRMRVDYALRQHEQWYKGDGLYGDGPDFHWDYYNSFVIHPMLLDILRACGSEHAVWTKLEPVMVARAQRYAAIQERLVAPDGSFPAIGRSLAYRCGAFHALAQLALSGQLPSSMPAGQARRALTRVMRRTLDAPGTFDAQGWLQIGLCGHQPEVGETYISTGSLYLCSVALLPLGLRPDATFWTEPEQPTTAERAWSGQTFPIDHALQA
jgi:hypothetical protein